MEYTLRIAQQYQEKINRLRPLTGSRLQNVKDYYRISLTFTSNALEGNTLSESETKVILEDGLTVGGHPLREIYEATGHSRAYDYMWSLVHSNTITQRDILELHRLFYEHIQSERAGVYRTEDVIITGSAYGVTEWRDIPKEMTALCDWIVSERLKLHPIVFAAELHRRFIYIHPFIDGNGRTARLLLNTALIQDGYEIVTIPPILRSDYIASLERGHKNADVFHGFIIDREVEAQKDMMRLFHIPLKDGAEQAPGT